MKIKLPSFSLRYPLFVFGIGSALLTGCAGTKENIKAADSAAEMYQHARAAFDSEDYLTAMKRLERIEARYPFGNYAQQAHIERIYAHYRMEEWEQAQSEAERFIRDYPLHQDLDYIYYMQGVIGFERVLHYVERWPLPKIDRSETDAQYADAAFSAFSELIRRYPDSEYIADAQQRMIYLRNRRARHEMAIVNYYYERKAYVAAANRAQEIIIRYQQTPSAQKALLVLEKCYEAMNLPEMAQHAREVYNETYKKSSELSQT